MPDRSEIRVIGARQHNLKNVSVTIPRDRLVVFTGVSGSGKSSLAFDTIFAEGQRRYVESLSAYARQFLGQVDKPDVERIEGLSPAISIDQKSTSHNPRSTVGTVTEIYDYLRLLFGRAGEPHCPHCSRPITPQTVDQIADRVMQLPDDTRFQLLAPVVRGKKGTHANLLSSLTSQGFVRARVDGVVQELTDTIKLKKNVAHDIEVVVDRLVKRDGIQERLVDSLTTCLREADGVALVELVPREPEEAAQILKAAESVGQYKVEGKSGELIFSEKFACPAHGSVMDELSPRLFSFNSPLGACPACHGLGYVPTFDPDLIVPDPSLPIYAAIAPWAEKDNPYYLSLLSGAADAFGFDIRDRWTSLSVEQQDILLYGSDEEIFIDSESKYRPTKGYYRSYEGVIPQLQRHYREAKSDVYRQKLEKYLIDRPCSTCHGARLKPEVLAVTIGGHTITDFTEIPIDECLQQLEALKLTPRQAQIGDLVLREIQARLKFLLDVGLDYLTLGRPAATLSGGEAQRIRLATQIGAGLTGVLYVLDEPSIGLHQRDNRRLLDTLKRLRDLGNTLIVVEHDEETMYEADHIVDIGPGAGGHGGEIVAQGTIEAIANCELSITGRYLSGRSQIPTPSQRRSGKKQKLTLQKASRNNLKHVNVDIPLGRLVCITGVSGSGKSTLINELLYPAIRHQMGHKVPMPAELDKLAGAKNLDKVIVIDQSPIGRTPRSNPATYTGVFDCIRQTFAKTIEAKARGYQPGHFSFNVKGGRCEACKGQGVNKIEMNFLPDVYVMCDVCNGSRYSRETLQVRYKGKTIADVLNMTVSEALEFFAAIAPAKKILQTLEDVGLNYIRLGQSAPTLSGGEAQRVKLASELSKRSTGKTLYLLDEPSNGLSFYDVHKLLDVMQRLVDTGNTVLVIEHNLDIIRCADWIVDLGPEGGNRGGEIVAVGTPEEVADIPTSYTGQYLRQVLERHPPAAAPLAG
ncbi:excinuclease ABC subunit UvrA [Synechococcus sp. PCC 7336]|uniref:excinuclease ABC subunit UvrA n=1 Tax=Synechococcus sp. PCC 7336 TaxID=195250 RepID=UPI000344F8A1|nr:excinuclease ABC subunit UvrA [Synechococcus sp. PCC 7336]